MGTGIARNDVLGNKRCPLQIAEQRRIQQKPVCTCRRAFVFGARVKMQEYCTPTCLPVWAALHRVAHTVLCHAAVHRKGGRAILGASNAKSKLNCRTPMPLGSFTVYEFTSTVALLCCFFFGSAHEIVFIGDNHIFRPPPHNAW